eukprot:GHVN01089078.1.p1 GENE.GHVN01089078.1~~GHVN01089078.1.p1  ORF type:complete len:370 (+),score=17.58 GHVN01089078.1:90-1199(+)
MVLIFSAIAIIVNVFTNAFTNVFTNHSPERPEQIAEKKGERPSAKLLLTSKPPFDDSDIIKLFPVDSEAQPLIKSPNTVVTGYFRARSKHTLSDYDGWMPNMLSLQDAMVIFTQPDLVHQIKHLRSHAVNRTVIVPVNLDDLPIGKLFGESFWQDQLDRDPEKNIHQSYQVFWIWLSKSWSVAQAIRMNVYDSDVFLWCDIGLFRDTNEYNFKTLVEHRELVPRHEILHTAHRKPNPPDEELFFDKFGKKANFYHAGGIFIGYKDTLLTFHVYFLETLDRFLENEIRIVDDQCVLQSVCLSHPQICAYVPSSQVNGRAYVGLRAVLHHGGKFSYWRHPPQIPGIRSKSKTSPLFSSTTTPTTTNPSRPN